MLGWDVMICPWFFSTQKHDFCYLLALDRNNIIPTCSGGNQLQVSKFVISRSHVLVLQMSLPSQQHPTNGFKWKRIFLSAILMIICINCIRETRWFESYLNPHATPGDDTSVKPLYKFCCCQNLKYWPSKNHIIALICPWWQNGELHWVWRTKGL